MALGDEPRRDRESEKRESLLSRWGGGAAFLLVNLVVVLLVVETLSYLVNSLAPAPRPMEEVSPWLAEHSDYRKWPNWTPETVAFLRERGEWKTVRYESFIGWRGDRRTGDLINTDEEGDRRTVNSADSNATATFDFYGGSTMWGHGVGDANTIPSLFAKLGKTVSARNFAEWAYNSRQELNLFLNNVARGRIGAFVIFYDGVNDIQEECFQATGPFGDSRAKVIRSVMRHISDEGAIRGLASEVKLPQRIALLLPNTSALFERMTGRSVGGEFQLDIDLSDYEKYICNNPAVAALVAENLVRNWETAALVARSHAAKFLAVLQPNPYTSDVEQPYFNKGESEMMRAVYPLIRARALKFDWFVDGAGWLAGRSDLYTDECCHLNATGNAVIADRLIELVSAIERK